jgi:hypothetical protein
MISPDGGPAQKLGEAVAARRVLQVVERAEQRLALAARIR